MLGKGRYWIGMLLLAGLANACAPASVELAKAPEMTQARSTPSAAQDVTETKVIHFTPALPNTEAREGYCWTASLADRRADAFRCMIGNQIFDPCFVLEGDKVVCGANPVTKEPGFPLKLTQPLPAARSPSNGADNWAWMVELADGTVCSFLTGATGGFEGKRLNYGCSGRTDSDSVMILSDLQPGKIWYANKVIVSSGPSGISLKKSEMVPVRTVWQ